MKPIIILGVPRSGTTLLRTLLGNHPDIFALPETPWITGAYDTPGLYTLHELLSSCPNGPLNSELGLSEASLHLAARAYFDSLVSQCNDKKDAHFVLLKTPDDIPRSQYLLALFPDALWLHIRRDGRDVALSNRRAGKEKFGSWMSGYGVNNLRNALKRWTDWEAILENFLHPNLPQHHLRYEDLVETPEETLCATCEFIGIPYQDSLLSTMQASSAAPAWEQGSADLQRHKGVNKARASAWKTELTPEEAKLIDQHFGDILQRYGYPISNSSVEHSSPQSWKPNLSEKAHLCYLLTGQFWKHARTRGRSLLADISRTLTLR